MANMESMNPQSESKAGRRKQPAALQRASPSTGLPGSGTPFVAPGAVELPRDVDLEVGFQLIARHCLRQIQCHGLGVVRSTDPESVHLMRVGLRRLRSALRLFSPWIALPRYLRDGLDWLGGALGAARDAEVLASGTLPSLTATVPADRSWELLQQAVADAARERRCVAATAVGSTRYAELIDGIAAWVQTTPWRSSLDEAVSRALREPLGQHAGRMLARLHRKLLAAGRHLPKAPPERRHRARIAAKRLRYAAEFFESLYPPEFMQPYIRRLSSLQDALGRLNDAVVAEGLLARAAKTRHADARLVGAARRAKTMLRGGARRNRHDLRRRWARFRRTRLPSE